MTSVAFQMANRHVLDQPRASSQGELLADLFELARRLDEPQPGWLDETAAVRATLEMTRSAEHALAIVTALERLDAAEGSPAQGEQDCEPETWVGVRGATAPARLGDVCFACSLELNIALRALEQAREHDARLSAVETARRKLLRAIHAVARAAPAGEPLEGRAALDRRLDDELASALAVRRLYAEFRQNLRRPAGDSDAAVLTALRYAAGALAALKASPHYRAVRVSDAALLRSQRERLLGWSRSGNPRAEGLQLLEDICTSASLLRGINRRQELRAHDTELIRRLLGLQSLERAEWLRSLELLVGLDDELDRLTAQLREADGMKIIPEIAARLSLWV